MYSFQNKLIKPIGVAIGSALALLGFGNLSTDSNNNDSDNSNSNNDNYKLTKEFKEFDLLQEAHADGINVPHVQGKHPLPDS